MSLSVEQVQEVAKKLVWAEEFDTLNNQYQVSMQQYKDLAAVYGKVDYIVTDGSLLHGLYYNRYNPTNVCDRAVTEKKIVELFFSFNNIVIFLKRGNWPYEQAGRIQNKEEADHVDKVLLEILHQYKIPYREFTSDENQVDAMIQYILSQ